MLLNMLFYTVLKVSTNSASYIDFPSIKNWALIFVQKWSNCSKSSVAYKKKNKIMSKLDDN